MAEAALEFDNLMGLNHSGNDDQDFTSLLAENMPDCVESNSNPSAESKHLSIDTSADYGAEVSAHTELSSSIDSNLSGDEVLNWRLSGVDFESPAKLKIILRQSDESELISTQDEHSEDRSAGDELYAASANGDSEVGSLWAANREDFAVLARPLPDPEPKFRFHPKVTNGHLRRPTVTHGTSSVEFSVPLTQYLYVPSISTSEFPLIQASFSDIDGERTEAAVVTQLREQWDLAGAQRLQISCILLLKDWAHIARQRSIVRKAVADDEWYWRQHQHKSVLGLRRHLDKIFKCWVAYAVWKTSGKSLSLLCTRQLAGIVFLQWKAVSCENAFVEQMEELRTSVHTVTRAAHLANVATRSCGEVIGDMRGYSGYTNLLCRSMSVRSWLRAPTSGDSRKPDSAVLPRSFFSWKDTLRDSKLVQLHWRIEQIEALLSEPAAQAHQPLIGSGASGGAKFDRICLEKLSREMLLSVGRGEDDELQERIVLLLQIVTEVNQATD
uniref:Uncharacterized protein n=1 Tax=Cryptomonas curvata TaxID=233186 RepID=A0A7S0QH67_9CRYP|mmetsp:Transcript_23203/g.48598  ORF Transcript_23203/g.48598 Transcript_23203/m.48598 type:complete len:498 (+) Transcript_23203:52-1545(+)